MGDCISHKYYTEYFYKYCASLSPPCFSQLVIPSFHETGNKKLLNTPVTHQLFLGCAAFKMFPHSSGNALLLLRFTFPLETPGVLSSKSRNQTLQRKIKDKIDGELSFQFCRNKQTKVVRPFPNYSQMVSLKRGRVFTG